jgi:hypothetical protein
MMSRGGGGGGTGGNFSAPRGVGGSFNGGAFNGGNMSARGDSRMGGMGRDHDRGHERDGRGRGFAFGFYPGYDYGYYDNGYYDNGYDDGCYQARQVPTRYGLRWRRVWVCD